MGHLHLPTFTSLACLLAPQDVKTVAINNNKIIVCFIFCILTSLKLVIFLASTISDFILQKKIIHKKILIAPLDWGLGHVTRCIPLIHFLQQMGCEIIVAADGEQVLLLKQEFPGITTISLKGYNITYAKYKRWMPLKILWQVPKILRRIQSENKWLKKKIKSLNIDMVISDNRYGLYTKKIPCVFMTHQLLIKAPFAWLEDLTQKINYRYINHYNECWVPDVESEVNMAGLLSHPRVMPAIPVKYIGSLCRFELKKDEEKKYDYLFILSGPEPQRTILEEKILKIIPQLKGRKMMIRGKPGEKRMPEAPSNCTIKNHVTTDEFQKLLNQSAFIISRCGYTTVMEILSLRKKAILIPTPGQTEQEYLAKHLMEQQWCYSCGQEEDLRQHVNNAKKFPFTFPSIEANMFQSIVKNFLKEKR